MKANVRKQMNVTGLRPQGGAQAVRRHRGKAIWSTVALATVCGMICGGLSPTPVWAAGDLLVAPSRLVLDGVRNGELVVSNIGTEEAVYRVSLELRRMTPDGGLEDVDPAQATDAEKAALQMISYAPRRVTLLPEQTQAVRIGVRSAPDLPDGEYRAHLLFRAVPKPAPPAPVDAPDAARGVSISLTPIYGITVPVIVRKGAVAADVKITAAKRVVAGGQTRLDLDMTRAGQASAYGSIRVRKPGVAKPIFTVSGIALYPEVAGRHFSLNVPDEAAAALTGPVSIDYVDDRTGRELAHFETALR